MEYENRCIKFDLPNGNCIDILNNVFQSIKDYIQFEQNTPESAGFLLGYQNRITNNITISDFTVPHSMDIRSRFFCVIKDAFHFLAIKEKSKNQNYYVGVIVPMYRWIPFKEQFSQVTIESLHNIEIDGINLDVLMLSCSDTDARNSFAAVCKNFVEPGSDGMLRNTLVTDPASWWAEGC